MARITPELLDSLDRVRPDLADLTFTNGADTAIHDLVSTLRDILNADTNEQVEDILSEYDDLTSGYADERTYTLYWLTGDTQTVAGPDPATAMNNAGIGAGALSALDFWQTGPKDPDYFWDADKHKWQNKTWTWLNKGDETDGGNEVAEN